MILDDDIDVNALIPDNLENTLEEDVGDNNPTIADVIDERPEHVQIIEKFRQNDRWKLFSDTQDNEDASKTKKSKLKSKRHDSESDQSPVRTQTRVDSDSDQSSSRIHAKRNDSDSDLSPARNRHDSESDTNTGSKQDVKNNRAIRKRQHARQDSDSDQSVPRKHTKLSDSDQSPIRRQKRGGSDIDQSPVRRQKRDSNSKRSRDGRTERKRHNSDSDQSPARRRKPSRFETSPVRERPDKTTRNDKNKEKMKTTLGGAKAGLSSAKMLREETEKIKRKELDLFNKIGDEKLGRFAKTVVRGDKRRDLIKEAEKAEKQAAKAKKYEDWGKGLAQSSQQERNVEEAAHEMSKPLARYRDDDDLDEELKAVDRTGDPMLAFLTKKKEKAASKKKALPKYKGREPPPNRYKIWPGYRWDGVNRSNGFEKKLFENSVNKKALAQEAYKWSVEDM